MYAAYRNHAGVVQLLLESGADLTVQNEDDMTAMELAVGQGNAAGTFYSCIFGIFNCDLDILKHFYITKKNMGLYYGTCIMLLVMCCYL